MNRLSITLFAAALLLVAVAILAVAVRGSTVGLGTRPAATERADPAHPAGAAAAD